MKNVISKIVKYAFFALLIINIFVTAGIIHFLTDKSFEEETPVRNFSQEPMLQGDKYLLYIGLNDKDTYRQEITTEEARDIVNSICIKYTGGYTASDANGGWKDETDTFTRENTLVYAFYDVPEETLIKVMDEVLQELNQNSILVEAQQAYYTYYSGH